VLRVERWVDESIIDMWERLERAWMESKRECLVWESDCGSVLVREDTGRVVSRLRYVDVIGSLREGGSRGEGVSKYGASSS